MAQSDGQEILIVDSDEKVQRGLEQMLKQSGLVPTLLSDPVRALDLSREKYFAVALIDLDTPTVGAGVDLIQKLHDASPATTVLMMAARKHFDVAVAAFRAGCADVVVKAPDQVDYLRRKVLEAAGERHREADTKRLLGDTMALHEDLIKVLLEVFKRAVDLEEKLSGASALPSADDTGVLLVDDDFNLHGQLQLALDERGGYQLRAVGTGGEALDVAGRERFQIALIKEGLPDLPGRMVVRSVKAQSPDTICLIYQPPGDHAPGRVDVIDGSRAIAFLAEFRSMDEILGRLGELRDAALATARERHYHAAFRQQHFNLLRRFADLKSKLQKVAAK